MTEADERHLRRAIELAGAARGAGDMPYGSLLVGPTGDVLAEDRNTVVTEQDITAHPELKLARWAGRQLDANAARQTTMYTSCQPCPMCAYVIGVPNGGSVMRCSHTTAPVFLSKARMKNSVCDSDRSG